MSIFKDTFRNYVRDQLSIREKLIEIGNLTDNNPFTNRRQSNTVTLQSGNTVTLPADSYYQYTLNKQCGIRLTSLVDYVEDVGLELDSYDDLKGASLSERFILEGGTLIKDRFIGENQSTVRSRGGIKSPGNSENLAYGDPFIAADASDGFGMTPMPGIIDAQVRTKTAYGSLREAKVNFECHNRRQLEILEMLYMRPGYCVLLEWASTPYINNDGNVMHNVRLVENVLSRGKSGESDLYTNNITQPRIYNAINTLKRESCGNYDGFLGFIKNFGYQAREDGGYSCYTELVTLGEVIESLKAPNLSAYSPLLLPPSPAKFKDNSEPDRGDELTYAEAYTGLDRETYSDAVDLKLIPEYNGLEGLTKSLVTYTTFNDFTLTAGKGWVGKGTDNSREADNVFLSGVNGTFRQDLYVKGKDPLFGGTTANRIDYPIMNPLTEDAIWSLFPELDADARKFAQLGYTETIQEDDSSVRNMDLELDEDVQASLDFLDTKAGDRIATKSVPYRALRLETLLRYRGYTIQETLISKLGVKDDEELRNYIIPRGGVTYNTFTKTSGIDRDGYRNVDDVIYRNDQPFIRWDALCMLINDGLIPQSENGLAPIQVVADRVYEVNEEKIQYRLDPLKFAKITELNPSRTQKHVYDFSTDPNICILPIQFEAVSDEFLKDQLGYSPDLEQFPSDYITAVYGSRSPIYYDEKIVNSGTKLLASDRSHRIGNIFLNINMIDDIAYQNADNDNYSIGNFITDIWDEVNKACPNHNFVLTDDKECNSLYIIDLPVNKEDIPEKTINSNDLHEFVPFSNKNILRKFEYTSNIPSALSATVAIQGQDPRSIQDIDGVTFAAFNRSIKNRLFSNNTVSSWSQVSSSIASEADELTRKRQILDKELYEYRFSFFKNLSNEANGIETQGGNISGILREYQQMNAYTHEALKIKSDFTSIIPLEFSATLDGISGIVIGNLFKIQKDRLPKAYAKTNVAFIVHNEQQQITAGGEWTTDISGKIVIIDPPTHKKLPVYNDFLTREFSRSTSFFVTPGNAGEIVTGSASQIPAESE